jgi:hypothetical protein
MHEWPPCKSRHDDEELSMRMRTEPSTASTRSPRRLTPCGQARREFLWQAGGGFVGTALAWMLGRDGFFETHAAAASRSPLAPRPAHFAGRAKSVICLFMYGGVSQVDTFDPKPELARWNNQPYPHLDADPLFKSRGPGNLLASKYQFAPAGDCGTEISELYPHLARQADRLAVVRSCYTDSFAHGSGLLQMNTGFVRQGSPSLGSWVTYGLGSENENLPSYVVMLDQRGGPIGGAPNWGAGYMPAAYQGTQFRTAGDPVLNLQPPAGVSRAQQRNELDLLSHLADIRNAGLEREDELAARLDTYELAYRMQAHAPEAVDLSQETEETLQLYGFDNPLTEPFGRRCLLARRLVERGVRFVQVYSGGGHNDQNWDAHGDVNANHELHCGETDRPMAALLIDLARRGLLDATLVLWTAEFGRTPTGQNGKGRDHSPRGFSTWMAGGGVRGGVAYGATDEFGYQAVENPVHVHDLHATALHCLGLDHERLTYFHGGREMRLTDVAGRVVQEILV